MLTEQTSERGRNCFREEGFPDALGRAPLVHKGRLRGPQRHPGTNGCTKGLILFSGHDPLRPARAWLRLWPLLPATALGHELVEFGLVLGHAQAAEEVLEITLLLFEPAQRLGPILIER
jgi:hypothetical protein